MPAESQKTVCNRDLPKNDEKLNGKSNKSTENVLSKPFFGTFKGIENNLDTFYGGAFNPYIKWPKTQVFAAVAGMEIVIYELPAKDKEVRKIDSHKIKVNIADDFFALAWCSEMVDGEMKQKIVVGGKSGRIVVLDYPLTQSQTYEWLIGCGGAVNEIRTCPVNPTLIAVASADRSVRVFDIRAAYCLLLCGGRLAHLDQVSTLDWHPDGLKIVSGGVDHRVICWNLAAPAVKAHLEKCLELLDRDESLESIDLYQGNVKLEEPSRMFDLRGYSMCIPHPTYHVSNLHYDSVDSVRCLLLGPHKLPYYLSKDTNAKSAVILWRFGTYDDMVEVVKQDEAKTSHVVFSRKTVPDGGVWFAKFEVDPKQKWLVVGGTAGKVHFYDLRHLDGNRPKHTIRLGKAGVVPRQIHFCNGGHIIFIVGDKGSFWRLDKSPEGEADPMDIW